VASLEGYAQEIGEAIFKAQKDGCQVQVFQTIGGFWYLDVVAQGPSRPYDFAQAWAFGEGDVRLNGQSQ